MARHQRVPESPKSSAYRRSSHKSSKRRKQEETVAAKPLRDVPHDQPNVEELRRARQGYYAQTAQERERKSRQDIDRSSAHDVTTAATTTTTATTAAVKVKKSTPQKSPRVDEHGRKRRKHRSSTTTTSNRKNVSRRSRPDKESREHQQESDYVYGSVREETAAGSKEVGGKEREDGADDRMGSVLSTRRSLERKERRRSVSPRVIPPEVTRTASTRSRKSYRAGDASPKKSKSRRSSGVSSSFSSSREKDGYRSHDFQPVNSHQRSTTRISSSSNRDHRQSESRPQLKRRTTKAEAVRLSRRISEPVPAASSTAAGKTSASKAHDRRKPTGLFGSIFAPKPQVPPKKVECLTCLSDDVPASKAAKLSCGHRMCHACLRRIFTMSVTDPQHMPPRCCTQDSIPLKHVDRLFNDKFKILWNRKYQEYTTKNRIYCPARGCGEWIKPSHIHMDSSVGRRYGKCSRCKMKVCCLCNGKWHTRKECPKDEETKRFVEIAKEAGWQRCFNCKAMVELREGCNHMTCRCTAEFCMLCGNVWKTCDCPWFNYTMITDQLNGMNVPEPIRVMLQQHEAHAAGAGAGRRQQGRRRMPANGNQNPNPRNPALTYQQEMDRRRAQERADEDLARRLQQQTFNEDNHDDNDNANGHGEAGAAAAARIYIHNYHRYRARRERTNRSNDNNLVMRNQDHDDPDMNIQMHGRAAMAALATQLADAAYNNMRATAAEAVAEPATTASRAATTGTTARRAEMRRATAAALARSTASVDLQAEAEGAQRPQASQNHRQRRRESQRRREGRVRRVQDDEPAIARRASEGTGTAVMAGLTRNGRGLGHVSGTGSSGGDVGRVGAWLRHVEREEEEEEKEVEEEYIPAVPGAWTMPTMRSAAIG